MQSDLDLHCPHKLLVSSSVREVLNAKFRKLDNYCRITQEILLKISTRDITVKLSSPFFCNVFFFTLLETNLIFVRLSKNLSPAKTHSLHQIYLFILSFDKEGNLSIFISWPQSIRRSLKFDRNANV